MGELIPANEISEEDYRAIEEAVMETARGRWFLAEYAKRNRVANTNKVLDAIEGIKSYISREHEPADVMQMRLDIVDMTQKIEQIKIEVANTENDPDLSDASLTLNVVVDETENATSNILNAAEQIQGLAWEIREKGGLDAECDKIDEFATEIYMACSFQDLTGQRVRKVVQLTDLIEKRLKAMVDLWGEEDIARYRTPEPEKSEVEALTNGPAMPSHAKGQDEIDQVLSEAQGLDVNTMNLEDVEWQADDESEASNDPFVIDDTDEDADFYVSDAHQIPTQDITEEDNEESLSIDHSLESNEESGRIEAETTETTSLDASDDQAIDDDIIFEEADNNANDVTTGDGTDDDLQFDMDDSEENEEIALETSNASEIEASSSIPEETEVAIQEDLNADNDGEINAETSEVEATTEGEEEDENEEPSDNALALDDGDSSDVDAFIEDGQLEIAEEEDAPLSQSEDVVEDVTSNNSDLHGQQEGSDLEVSEEEQTGLAPLAQRAATFN